MTGTAPVEARPGAGEHDDRCLLAIEDLRFQWPGDDTFTLEIEAFHLAREEKLFLQGPSGSGKSTLLGLICGIVAPNQGSIRIDDVDIARLHASQADRLRADKLGIIFQQFNLLPYGSMLQNVLLPLRFSASRRQRVSAAGNIVDEARRLLTRLGLDASLHDHDVNKLSVGQQQRVAVARAMIGVPRLIIADEPTSALDAANRDEFLALLFEEVSRADASLILVSHDESLATDFDRRLDIADVAVTGRPGDA